MAEAAGGSGANSGSSGYEYIAMLQALTSRSKQLTKEQLQDEIEKITKKLATAGPNAKPQPRQEPDLTKTQLEPLQGMDQNEAGGYSYVVDDLTKLKRYIVLGKESSVYNIKDPKTDLEKVPCVLELIKNGRGKEVIDTIRKFATEARVAKEENILVILRDCAMYEGEAKYDENTSIQRAAYDSVVKICNIPTKLFRFLELCEPTIKKVWKPDENKPMSKRQLRKRKKEEDQAAELENNPNKKKKKKKNKRKTKTQAKKLATAKKSSAWGRQRRRGIAQFYTDENKDANRLLLLLTKYKSRHNWTHVQALGYAHPKMSGDEELAKNIVLKYCTRGLKKCEDYILKTVSPNGIDATTNQIIGHIKMLEEVKQLNAEKQEDRERLVQLIKQYGERQDQLEFTTLGFAQKEPLENKEKKKVSFQLVREHLPTGFHSHREIWEALLQDMPMTALIRNLGRMTSMGVFENEENIKVVERSLSDSKHLRKAKIHPVKVLIASRTYEQGHGDRGRYKDDGTPLLNWNPLERITKALDKAFYLSFKQADQDNSGIKTKEGFSFRTGKKFMLALDVSGSMTWSGCYGCQQITPAVAATALTMVTWNIEDKCGVYAFGGHLEKIEDRLRKDMTISEAMKASQGINFGRTDCSLPMQHALEKKMDVDVFIIYTDSDTWHGKVHPSEALVNYRKKMNKPEAKLLVVAMQSNNFSIADPKDPFMFDICGFDADVPDIICEFAKGNIS